MVVDGTRVRLVYWWDLDTVAPSLRLQMNKMSGFISGIFWLHFWEEVKRRPSLKSRIPDSDSFLLPYLFLLAEFSSKPCLHNLSQSNDFVPRWPLGLHHLLHIETHTQTHTQTHTHRWKIWATWDTCNLTAGVTLHRASQSITEHHSAASSSNDSSTESCPDRCRSREC